MPLIFDKHIPSTATHDVMITVDAMVMLSHVFKLYLINAFSPVVPRIKNGQTNHGKDK